MAYPVTRHRRLRKNPVIRDLVRETSLSAKDLVMPLFVRTGKGIRSPIASMPGNYQFSVDQLIAHCRELFIRGIKSVLLFGIPDQKDETGDIACDPEGIVQQAVRSLKESVPGMYVITDICNCEYTTHGHCGTIRDGDVDNDRTLETLARQSVSLAQAGVDMVAPSDMMDGRVGAIREALDKNGFSGLPVMSYSAKFASAFYGPFREAAGSTPEFGDRKSYQMDPANRLEALREAESDIEEGADIIMVKPALAYLDVIREVKDTFNIPLAAYNVSGEFSMVKAAAEKGWIDENKIVREILTSIKRAGADIIISYHSQDIIGELQE
ncbi:MAG: porphobilinogen synthase [Bacteroidales bacterium]